MRKNSSRERLLVISINERENDTEPCALFLTLFFLAVAKPSHGGCVHVLEDEKDHIPVFATIAQGINEGY